jgi:nucleotide-binding universal stress UspA family protein
MERALVVVDDTEQHRDLLREAGELAAGSGATLVLVTTMNRDEYGDASEAIAAIEGMEGIDYGESPILQTAAAVSEHLGEEVLADLDVEWEAVGAVVEAESGSNPAETILDQAESHGCDHVFMTGRRRSPTGKAVFGDTAQSVLLNFDGPVTVTMS